MIDSQEGYLKFLNDAIEEKSLQAAFVDTKVWKVWKGVIEHAVEKTKQSMRVPDRLEFKSGQLDAFSQILDMAGKIEKDLKILSLERENLIRGEGE